jgi:mannose-P-dolichol utilization defect protein 1
METVRELLAPLIAPTCFDKFLEYDFDVPCLKQTLSKGLGIGIIAGSVMVKVPQIVKIIRGRSAAGITFFSVVLELFAISSSLAYSYMNGYPFSAWGEACFLAVQTAAIAALVLWYNYSSGLLALSFIVGYSSVIYALTAGMVGIDILWSMQAANVPVIVFSKMLQALTNYKNKSTGQLSAVTLFMLFAGSLARIFTSLQETGDNVLVVTYLAASLANGTIVFQILYYWNSKIGGTTGGGKKKSANANGPAGKGGKGKGQGSPKKGGKKH